MIQDPDAKLLDIICSGISREPTTRQFRKQASADNKESVENRLAILRKVAPQHHHTEQTGNFLNRRGKNRESTCFLKYQLIFTRLQGGELN